MEFSSLIEGELYLYSAAGRAPRKIRCVELFDDFASCIVEDDSVPSNGTQMNISELDARRFVFEIPKQVKNDRTGRKDDNRKQS